MNAPTFTTVRTAGTLMEAQMLISSLQREGLHPMELGNAGHFSFAGVDIEYPIQVPGAEVEAAKEILKSYEAPLPVAESVAGVNEANHSGQSFESPAAAPAPGHAKSNRFDTKHLSTMEKAAVALAGVFLIVGAVMIAHPTEMVVFHRDTRPGRSGLRPPAKPEFVSKNAAQVYGVVLFGIGIGIGGLAFYGSRR